MPDDLIQAFEIAEAALQLSSDQRASYLDSACPDPLLRKRVESLLLSHEEAGVFLKESAFVSYAKMLGEEHTDRWIGRQIGPYRLVQEIGQGGMGVVYRALRVDDEYQKQVAIKLVKAGLDSKSSLARFKAERQILANLEHPNIARLLDGGTAMGVPYFVMEFVEGQPIDEYCRARSLSVKERLQLFRIVCSAVQYAHENHVVHRDLKPSNILVTATGVPKLLDFGIAKILDTESFRDTLEPTVTMIQALTPDYASPEQVRGEAITPATDIYSLGAVLYLLLSGKCPYSLEGRSLPEIARIICEIEPAAPSESVSDKRGDAEDTVGAEKTDEPGRSKAGTLRHSVTGDLDNIVLKALRKDPERRYASVEQFSEDIRRHLDGLPILARRHTTPYRAAKFVRRNLPLLSAAALLLFFLLVGVGWFSWRTYKANVGVSDKQLESSNAATDIRSIAGLPLANLSGNASQDFFADGMTAELIGELSKIAQLRVVSRTSVMSYKGKQTALPQIARELGVNALLEGSVARSGNRVRIVLGLYDGRSDRELWSETFDRTLNEILALEDEVAHAVALHIRLKLSSSAGPQRAATDAGVYDLYLKGRYALDQGSEDQLKLALVYFREATEKDPHYAPLYAGLADVYSRLPFYTNTPPTDAFPQSKGAATKALQLDPDLAAAHASLAYVMNYYDWDRSRAEQEFEHALQLNPNDAGVHHAYSRFLVSLGRIDEARVQLSQAQELDPLSLLIQSNAGMISYFARQYDDAVERLNKVLELDPKFPVPYWGLGMCYEQKKKYAEALAYFQKGIELSGRGANDIASLGHAYGLAGRRAQAEKILIELKQRSKAEYVSSYQFALLHLGLGQNDQAIASLKEAYRERSTLLGYLRMDPRFDPLRSDPRFQDLLSRLHLSNETISVLLQTEAKPTLNR
jgi:serine/threonine protein kinase/Flp pilus assembly protein TadD